ncbi:hypothetical protein [Aureispira sp. CCB-E]|uniref:hypothetical protein n=1 Tax=Aureispira sp. CCB-E TaxID=3051121 RepID=UPI00286875B9|nr:hypothetical protein [Aureispira sp. CCB-E]WMX16543.1 hypothetical protein QP953_09205 [Aureispira sp. CCB-E]
MNLIYKEKFNKKDNHFVLKIWASILAMNNHSFCSLYNQYYNGYRLKTGVEWGDYNKSVKPKIHTIRADKKDRWKVGTKIHFVINPYDTKRFQFAPILKVTAIQTIQIRNIFNDANGVSIDGRELSKEEIQELAFNDGFDTVKDFWDYFKWKDFEGKIIHWTQGSNY